MHAGASLGGALVLFLVTGGRLVFLVIGLCAGAIGPYLYLSIKEQRRQAAFLEQLPETLQLMAGGLTAGYSLAQSVDAVVREGSDPIASEFKHALVDARLGVPIEDALEAVAARTGSIDFSWVVMAIRIQRDVGGNLSEVLVTVANTLRDRARIRRQVKVLSAEGRLSGWILGALPPLFALYLLLVRPEYIRPLYTHVIGLVMLGAGALFMVVGALWMRKVVRIEV